MSSKWQSCQWLFCGYASTLADPVPRNKQRGGPRTEQRAAPAPPQVGCYDGDTPQSDRAKIRKSARVVITNPDML